MSGECYGCGGVGGACYCNEPKEECCYTETQVKSWLFDCINAPKGVIPDSVYEQFGIKLDAKERKKRKGANELP